MTGRGRGMSKAAAGRPALALALALAMLLPACALALPGCSASARGTAPPEAEEERAPEPPAAPPAVVNPLNGMEAASADLVARRPLAVKVENDPAARPQSGLVDAEMVIEELVEGGVTRFICLFLAGESAVLGPNRSVRPCDIDILYHLQPLLICSGGAPQVLAMVRQSGLAFLEEDAAHFWRDPKRPAPHNLYTSTERLRAYLAEQGDAFDRPTVSGLAFRTEAEVRAAREALLSAAGGGEGAAGPSLLPLEFEVNQVAVAYGAGCDVVYRYDPATNVYARILHGKPHTDKGTGAQVAPRNVIIQYVKLSPSGVKDVTGSDTPNLEVVGTGSCLVFSGGKVYGGTWKKPDRSSPTRYCFPDGSEIRLFPGQTWLHLIPRDISVTVN